MPLYRLLHTKTLDSFDFNEMPDDFTRVCWLLLPLILDSEGRGIYSGSWLRSKLFPIRSDVEIDQIETAFNHFIDKGMIVVYEVDGRFFFYVPSWKTYQRGTNKEARSLFPDPPELLPTNSGVDQEHVKRKSESDAYTDAYTDADACANSEREKSARPPENGDHPVRQWIEEITGLTGNPQSIKAIDEIAAMGATRADIQSGYEWLREQGKVVRYYGQLVGPTEYAMAKRLGRSVSGISTLDKSMAAVRQVLQEVGDGNA